MVVSDMKNIKLEKSAEIMKYATKRKHHKLIFKNLV